MNALKNIWDNKLCLGCGACAAVCPVGVVQIVFAAKEGVYRAQYDPQGDGKCIQCEQCLQVCPAIHFLQYDSTAPLSPAASKEEVTSWLIGPYQAVYTGFAADGTLRYEASSGGVASALLAYLLQEKVIDSALVAAPVPGMPLRHQSYLVSDPNHLFRLRGTVYCQIDYTPTWKYLMEKKGRIGVIGQPCHLWALDNFIETMGLPQGDFIKIGLLCGGVTSHRSLDFLCRRKAINSQQVASFRYRSGGWPGRRPLVRVKEERGRAGKEVALLDRDASFFQSLLYRFSFSGPFFPFHCRTCKDQTAERADISLGDAWLPQVMGVDTQGTNLIIVRTDKGNRLIAHAKHAKVITLNAVPPESVIISQGNCLVGRKLGLWGAKSIKHAFHSHEYQICNKYFPEVLPKIRQLRERRIFQKGIDRLSARLVFPIFLMYFYTLRAVNTIIKGIVKTAKR